MKRQALFFLIAGSIGFAIDAGGVFVLAQLLGFDPIFSRVPAFICAVLATFLINRTLTFQSADTTNLFISFYKYISANFVAQGLNFLAYTALVLNISYMNAVPTVAVAIGSVSVMGLSFILSKYWVFR